MPSANSVFAGTAHAIFADPSILQQIAQYLPPTTVISTLPLVSRRWNDLFSSHHIGLAFAVANLAHGLPSAFHAARQEWRHLGPAYMAAMLVRNRFDVRILYGVCRDAEAKLTSARSGWQMLKLPKLCEGCRKLVREAVGVVLKGLGEATAVARMIEWSQDSLEVLGCAGEVTLFRATLEALSKRSEAPEEVLPLPVSNIRDRIASAMQMAVELNNLATVEMILELRRRRKEAEQLQPDPWRTDWEEEAMDEPMGVGRAAVTLPDLTEEMFRTSASSGNTAMVAALLSDTNTVTTRAAVLFTGTTASIVELLRDQFSPPNDVLPLRWVNFPSSADEVDREDTMVKLRYIFEDDRVVMTQDPVHRMLMDVSGAGHVEAADYILQQGRRYEIEGLLGSPDFEDFHVIPATVLASLCMTREADEIRFYVNQPECHVDQQAVEKTAELGKLEVLKMLLDHLSSAENRNEYAVEASQRAAANGHTEIVQFLVETYDVSPCSGDEHCLLTMAVLAKNAAALEMLFGHLDGDDGCSHLTGEVWQEAFACADPKCVKLVLPHQKLKTRKRAKGTTAAAGSLDLTLGNEEFWMQLYSKYELPAECLEAMRRMAVEAGFKNLLKLLTSKSCRDLNLEELLKLALSAGHYELVEILVDRPKTVLKKVDLNDVLKSLSTSCYSPPLFSDSSKAAEAQAKVRCISVLFDNPILRQKLNVSELYSSGINFLAIKAVMEQCKRDPSFFDPSQGDFLQHVFAMRHTKYYREMPRAEYEEEDEALAFLAKAVLEDPRVDPLFDDGLALRNCVNGMRWKVLDLLLEHPKVKAYFGEA
ncbi:hypothetical protein HDU96_000868 [Phlyctochytrium bullatum]|nr:hypothetical protein HDU96_000868 [Phlyctochytrium bullatum]